MKRITQLTLTLALMVGLSALFSDAAHGQDKAPGKNTESPSFIDADGDGVCDNFTAVGGKAQGQHGSQGKQGKQGKKMGPQDGTGNKGQGPKDGTGYGAMKNNNAGQGTCDGTGPKGNQTRAGRK